MRNVNLHIAGTEYSLKNKSYEIYIQGCFHNCRGCHNPETHDFEGGKEITNAKFLEEQRKKVDKFPTLIDNIYISGGDLLCSGSEVAEQFSNMLRFYFPDKILWLFTGFSECFLPVWVWWYYDILKCGGYDDEQLNPIGSFPASKNQKLIFNTNRRNNKLLATYDNTKFMGEKIWR